MPCSSIIHTPYKFGSASEFISRLFLLSRDTIAGYYHCIVRTGDTVAGVQRDPKYGSRDAKYSLVSNIGYLKVCILSFHGNRTLYRHLLYINIYNQQLLIDIWDTVDVDIA